MPPRPQEKPCDTLFVYNIPENINKIPLLFKHFKRYGHIKSIWCNQKVATIGYSTVEEATTAYHSPAAYQNNRFVFIKYHKRPAQSESHLADVADMSFVKKIAAEVKKEIETTQKKEEEERFQLISQQRMKNIGNDIASQNQIIKQYENIAINVFEQIDKTQDEAEKARLTEKAQDIVNNIEAAKNKIVALEKEQEELKQRFSQINNNQ